MADLLAHALLAYALFTVAGWRFDAVTDRWVAVALAFVVYGFDRYRSRPAESGEAVAASEEATE